MRRVMNYITAFCFAGAVLMALLSERLHGDIYLTLAITFGTAAYHLGMRLLVGLLFEKGMKNRADYTRKWYQVSSWENGLYRVLRVKAWKDKLPAYDPEAFSSEKHTWDEIAQAMCQAELVHEVNAALSFLPLAASFRFGSLAVFLITSVCAAAFDLLFVVMQRYNRPRVVRIALKRKGKDCVSL